jgi:hypothetical protein
MNRKQHACQRFLHLEETGSDLRYRLNSPSPIPSTSHSLPAPATVLISYQSIVSALRSEITTILCRPVNKG